MTTATPIPLKKNSQDIVIEYYSSLQESQNIMRSAFRSNLEKIDKLYQREVDVTDENEKAKAANRAGDPSRIQNITVPITKTQVSSALVYQASVFLTGHPLFTAVSSPEFADAALQLNTKIEQDARRGGWTRELVLFFLKGFKYNFSPLLIDWATEKTYGVSTDLAVNPREGVPKEIVWSGNKIVSLDPYNTFIDPRVEPSKVHEKGEYAGWTELMNRIQLKTFIDSLPDKILANVRPALESSMPKGSVNSSSYHYYIPMINPATFTEDSMRSGDTNWLAWAGLSEYSKNKNINYKDVYEVSTFFARVIPAEFEIKVPSAQTAQIYKFIVVNHEHIIYAERQTNIHNYLPVLVGQPEEDGLGYQTKSIAEDSKPFQDVTSAYMNSIVASRRRAISDRTLYDPSRVATQHINSANPSAKIPVRPSAYGSDISQAVYAFPYREDQAANSMQQIQMLIGLSNQLAGQNQASQGQFVKGNKTLHEFESVMQNANGRGQLTSIFLEDQVFIPLKHIIKSNILQYQGAETLFNPTEERNVDIDPIALRKAIVEFKLSDGLTPAAKLIQADVLQSAMQVMGSSHQIAAGYNIAPAFSYLLKTQNTDLSAFEKSQEQMAYEDALNRWTSLMQLAIEKGIDPNTLEIGERPTPEQFGYDPRKSDPTNRETTQQPSPTGVNANNGQTNTE